MRLAFGLTSVTKGFRLRVQGLLGRYRSLSLFYEISEFMNLNATGQIKWEWIVPIVLVTACENDEAAEARLEGSFVLACILQSSPPPTIWGRRILARREACSEFREISHE